MKMMTRLAAFAAMGLVGTAFADSMNFNPNLSNWGTGAGSGDSDPVTPQLVSTIMFNLPAVQSIDSASFVLSHSYLSDIHITLSDGSTTWILAQGEGPDGSPFQGVADTDDLGGGGGGSVGATLYNFVPFGGSTWNDGTTTQFGLLLSGDYNALQFPAGVQPAKTWTIQVWDAWDNTDAGYLGNVTLNYTVPAPASAALLAIGGVLNARRRR